MGQLVRSKVERRGQDELAGIDDAVIARTAVGVHPEDLKATVLKDVADVELDVRTHLAIEEFRAVASHQVGVDAGFVVDRFVRVVVAADAVGVGGGAEEADDGLVFPAERAADGDILQPAVLGAISFSRGMTSFAKSLMPFSASA